MPSAMLAFRAICLFDSPAATKHAISASRGVRACDWVRRLLFAPFSLSAGRIGIASS